MYAVHRRCAIIVCITDCTSFSKYVDNMHSPPYPTIVREKVRKADSPSHVLPEQETQGNATRFTNIKVGVDRWNDPH